MLIIGIGLHRYFVMILLLVSGQIYHGLKQEKNTRVQHKGLNKPSPPNGKLEMLIVFSGSQEKLKILIYWPDQSALMEAYFGRIRYIAVGVSCPICSTFKNETIEYKE